MFKNEYGFYATKTSQVNQIQLAHLLVGFNMTAKTLVDNE